MPAPARIEPLGDCPAAFAPLAAKINELVRAYNEARLEPGVGLALTRTDNGTRIDISGLTATGQCNDSGGIDITISGT